MTDATANTCPRCGAGELALLTGYAQSGRLCVNGHEWPGEPVTPTAADDPINPPHYQQGAVECIDAIAAATVGLEGIEAVCTGAAIKYLWRWKRKGGLEDLRKSAWYIDRLVNPPDVAGG